MLNRWVIPRDFESESPKSGGCLEVFRSFARRSSSGPGFACFGTVPFASPTWSVSRSGDLGDEFRCHREA